MQTLNQLKQGMRANVLSIRANTSFGVNDDLVTQRLMELGFVPGATLQVLGFGFLGRDPMAVKLGNTKFALRQQEASKIEVALV
ncbi:FeoA family protein [Permianibacter aggregans]|uniref:Ferrous iron transport protein A n=1 Tax=Permianibacter aggregans TaxID=1510150 RepID=A0A4R6UJZ1_9GAMM|nr:FeoA family protein [Permianibacter aggregans]TDQ45769.1 ferrous iron transport protein A [Permianibacter aggregans]